MMNSILGPDTCLYVFSFNGTPPYSYVWDNGSTSNTISNTVCQPVPSGTYCVTITDAIGCTDVLCRTVGIQCQSSFRFYQDSANNLTFHFIDLSVYNPISYQWDFGDGNSSSTQNPSHTYTMVGTYNVCLTAVDVTGCTATTCEQVNAGNLPLQELVAYHHHYTAVKPSFPLWLDIEYCNYGTTLLNGTVVYRYPVGTTFSSATPAPIAHNSTQRLLTFNFFNLLPGTCGSITVDLMVNQSLPLGTVVFDTAWVNPVAGEINTSNNISAISETVVGSWDPNDKAVSPKGIGDDGEIPVGTQTLSYKIRFQNTGTAPAVNVMIRDAINNNIDLSSVRVIDASHEHITEIIDNKLVMTFHNIMLPDSNSNEPASHGYIQVVANLKPGLTEGTQISNTAEIYFDFNEPVITNTVVNTLKNPTDIRHIASFDFSILPNPAQDQILISGKFSRNAHYEIINDLGQIVLSDDLTSDKMQVSVKDLKPGIYIVKIKSTDKTGIQRLVVNK